MKKILFVCLGNICRSPAAEAILKKKICEAGLEKEFLVDSAGIYGGHTGALPDQRMQKHAWARGYRLNSRARQFYASADFPEFDRIIAMDDQNVADLHRLAIDETERKKICKMTDFCTIYTSYSAVPDPYYGGEVGFELVLDLLEDATAGLLQNLSE